MLKSDRTLIADLLGPHFPALKKATSDEWQAFLNERTGLNIQDDEPNATAFDKWRQALAQIDKLPVWGDTPEKARERKDRAKRMLERENKRRAREGETLLQLRKEAP